MKIKSPAIIKSDNKITPVNLYDIINLTKTDERKIKINKISGYKIPTNNTNPVYKVAEELICKKPNKLGVEINIQKNIPTSSGLNSQFSNAASVLIALNELWGFNLSEKELLKIATKIHPTIGKTLRLYFRPKRTENKNVILLRPKYITTNENWLAEHCKMTTQSAYQAILFKHFPDIKQIISILKKQGYKDCGISGKGPIIFGYSEKTIDLEKIKKNLGDKIDFIWSGSTKTCNPYSKLLE